MPLSQSNVDNRFQVQRDPCLFADVTYCNLDFPQRCLDRDDAVRIGDGGGRASNKSAAADDDPLCAIGATIGPTNRYRQCSFQQDIFFER